MRARQESSSTCHYRDPLGHHHLVSDDGNGADGVDERGEVDGERFAGRMAQVGEQLLAWQSRLPRRR